MSKESYLEKKKSCFSPLSAAYRDVIVRASINGEHNTKKKIIEFFIYETGRNVRRMSLRHWNVHIMYNRFYRFRRYPEYFLKRPIVFPIVST